MPSIFPFEATTVTKISKGRTTRVSRGELGHEMASTSSCTKHFRSSVSKGSEGTGTEAAGSSCSIQQDNETHVYQCKQFENQVKQLEREVAESKGEAAELNRQLEEAKEENFKLKTFEFSQAREELIELKKQLKEAKDEIAKLTERLDEMNSQSKEYQKLAK